MATQPAELHVTGLLSYAIASADMFYAEMGRRDVFLSCNEQRCLRIWGRMTDEEPSTVIDLFEIFLEYALYCCSCVDTEETLHTMQDFGERLGRSLAKQLWPSILHDSAGQILKYIFETVDAHSSVENVDAGVRIIVADYPLEKTAERSGLWNIELAHCGINSMCESLIGCMNPGLSLSVSSDAQSEFIFTILTPSYA